MAVPAVVPVAVRLWAIDDPEATVAPDTPDCTTVQAKVVPVTLLLSATEEAVPEHIVCDPGVAVAIGAGFTVITIVTGVPAQLLAVGVMV